MQSMYFDLMDKPVKSVKKLSLDYYRSPFVGLVTYEDGLKVVVKEIHDSGSDEINILKKIGEHPNIIPSVALFDVFENQGKPLIESVQKYLDQSSKKIVLTKFYQGKDLRYFDHPSENHFRYLIARDIAAALEHIHSLRIVHADIKPPNVMFECNGQYKSAVLTDFDGAVYLGNRSQKRILKEPKKTFEPFEQVYDGQVSLKSDIFSLGVLIHFMEKGETPTFEELHLGVELAPLKNRTVDELVRNMLKKDYRKRPSAKEVKEVLSEL